AGIVERHASVRVSSRVHRDHILKREILVRKPAGTGFAERISSYVDIREDFRDAEGDVGGHYRGTGGPIAAAIRDKKTRRARPELGSKSGVRSQAGYGEWAGARVVARGGDADCGGRLRGVGDDDSGDQSPIGNDPINHLRQVIVVLRR